MSDTLEQLREMLTQADAVIALMTEYMDDLLDRSRGVTASHARNEAGPFALYVEARLEELVRRLAALDSAGGAPHDA